jgi:microcystin degradation protein MlrC
MRVGIIALLQETNTFIAEPTTLRHFEEQLLVSGQRLRELLADTEHEIGGFFEGLAQHKIEAVPIFATRALPYGTVTDETYAALKTRLLSELAHAGPLDGLLLAPHGATVSASVRDVDGDWLSAVRECVGPRMPIICTADPHANLSPQMVAVVDAMIAYRTNPHLDQRARGLEAAGLMARTLAGDAGPVAAAVFPPMIINIDRQCTDEEPCRSFCACMETVRQRPGILSASLFLGFPYADVHEMGSAIVVVADGDRRIAEQAARQLGLELWERRHEFVGQLVDAESAVKQAREMPGPVCLLDMGDNVGGGSAGDGTTLAQVLHHFRPGPSLICLYDPAAVQVCEAAGAGREVQLSVGGRTDALHGEPLSARFDIERVCDGRFEEPEARHGGIRHFDQGRTAIVRTDGGLTVMLTSRRMVPFSLHQLTDLGLDPRRFQFIVAKGVNAPLAAYRKVCPSIIRVNTPGATTAELTRLVFQHRRRPMFPFEPETTWSGGA